MAKEELFKRILFIVFAVPIVLIIIFLPVKYNILILLFILILIGLLSFEFYFCLKNKQIYINLVLFIVQSILTILSVFLYSNSFINFELLLFLILTILIITSLFYIFKKNISTYSLSLFLHLFGLFYISISLSFILVFYSIFSNASNLFLLFLLIVWSSNIFGYLIGMFWLPRNPLNLEVSPNKSLKGFLGAIFFGTFIPFSLTIIFPDFFHFSFSNKFIILILIFLTNIFSIMGDLFESAFKRFCGVKDSSNYLKGFGGILDSVDSILFAFPFYFSFLLFLLKNHIK
ncbi:MAG TPA: phosphatidate cytidylyltransferase [Exilispira sp.]|nr:phosphatidate cytidylyltransferase [Exilispira sp.]